MKKITLAAAALFAGLSAAHADEMPIKGACTSGPDAITFTGSRMPIPDPGTGDFGTTVIRMSTPDYKKMFENAVVFVTDQRDKEGYRQAGIGELGVSIKDLDEKNGEFFVRTSTDNFDLILKAYLPQWKCDIRPNF